jgi:hypothetical protein
VRSHSQKCGADFQCATPKKALCFCVIVAVGRFVAKDFGLLYLLLMSQCLALPAYCQDKVIDGELAPEHSAWDSAFARVLKSGERALEYQLPEPRMVGSVLLQADWNDSYHIDCFLVGGIWQRIATAVPAARGEGLVTRSLVVTQPQVCGAIRIRGEGGDLFYSVSELQLYAEQEAAGAVGSPHEQSQEFTPWLPIMSASVVERIKLITLILSIVFTTWIIAAKRCKIELIIPRYALYALAAMSFALWSNLGQFHYRSVAHVHEFLHYYLGAKYLSELGYDGLYPALISADIDEGLPPRAFRDLRTNLQRGVPTAEELAAYPKRFSSERWDSFKKDARWFRSHLSNAEYERALNDHGYNATPVWTLLGSLFVSSEPLNTNRVFAIALIDYLLLAGTWIICCFVWGGVPTALAIIVWGSGFLASFSWTGGGFLRADWLVAVLLGLCALRRSSWFLGGALLAYASLTRVFPLFFALAPLLPLTWRFVILPDQKFKMELCRYLLGLGVTTITLVLLSGYQFGGLSVWEQFLNNTHKHSQTYSTNRVGLPTLVSSSAGSWSTYLRDSSEIDSLSLWKTTKREIFESRRWLYYTIVLLTVGFWLFTVINRPPWVSVALAPLLIFNIALSNYDYYFLISLIFLYPLTPVVSLTLLCFTACSWPLSQVSGIVDVNFFLQSCAVGITLLCIAWQLWRVRLHSGASLSDAQ